MISSGVPSPLLLSETHGCLPANTAPIVYIQQASGDMPFETLETLPRSSLQDYCPRGSSTPPTYLKPICSSIQGGGTAAVHCRELNRASIGHRHFFLSNYDIPSVQCQLIPSICSTDRPVGAMTFDTNPHLLACPGLAPVLSFRKYALLWPPCPSCGRERGGAAPTPSPQLPSDLSSFPAKTTPMVPSVGECTPVPLTFDFFGQGEGERTMGEPGLGCLWLFDRKGPSLGFP